MKRAACPLRNEKKKRISKWGFITTYPFRILPLLMAAHSSKAERSKTTVNVICYNEFKVEKKDDVSIDQALDCIGKLGVTWINIIGPDRLDILWRIAEKRKIHPFVIEDAVENRYGRPKIEDFEDHIYMTWNTLGMREDTITLAKSQTGIILGKNYLISIQDEEDKFQNIVRLLQEEGTRIRKMGADYLLYALLDTVVDSYFRVSESIGEWIDKVQDQAVLTQDRSVLPRIMTLRRELVTFRRAIWPLREQINELEKGESDLISDHVSVYFRDVYDHTVELMDTVDTSRDMLSEMIDVYQSNVSLQLTEIVKILTIISVVFTPATFIASWYGMNFRNMPELNSPWGYPIVLASFLVSFVVLLMWFKRKGWF